MKYFFALLFTIGLLAFIVGMISPKLVMFGSQVKSRGKVVKRYLTLIIISAVGMGVTAEPSNSNPENKVVNSETSAQVKETDNKQQDELNKEELQKSIEEIREKYKAEAQAMLEEHNAKLAAAPFFEYKKYSRNPEQYIGSLVQLDGKVRQVIEGDVKNGRRELMLRVDVNPHKIGADEVVAVKYQLKDGEPRILEKDFVNIKGEFRGIGTYETVMGATVKTPVIDAEKLVIHN